MARSRTRTVLLKLSPTLAVCGIFLLGFLGKPEDSAWLNKSHLWGPGDPFYANAEERFVANALLVWRGRPSFSGDAAYAWGGVQNGFTHNGFGLRDDPVGSKSEGTTRILNLGDSATWGLNLSSRSETYSDQLEERLATKGSFDVVNGGTIGYSSLQGVQFLRYVSGDLEPDVVTVYLGNNDSAPARVKDAARLTGFSPLKNWLSRNFFYLLVQKAWFALRASATEKEWDALHEEMASKETAAGYQSKEAYYRQLSRGTPRQYGDNLRSMVEAARASGSRVVLLKVPMNLLWPQIVRPAASAILNPTGFWSAVQIEEGYLARAQEGEAPGEKPLVGHPYLTLVTEAQFAEFFARCEKAKGNRKTSGQSVRVCASEEELLEAAGDPTLSEPERFRARHNYGVARFVAGDYGTAREAFESVLADLETCKQCPIAPNLAKTQYMLGITLLVQGDRDRAFEELRASRDRWPFAMNPDFEKPFDEVVRELDVEWIDLPTLFAKEDPEFQGSALLHDWVHPNARGNRVIAEALEELIAK